MDCTFDLNNDSTEEPRLDSMFSNSPWMFPQENDNDGNTEPIDNNDASSAHDNLNTLLEHLRRKEQALDKREKEIEAKERANSSDILSAIESLRGLIENNQRKDEIISNLHSEITKHNENLADELMKPFLKSVIRIHDRLASTVANSRREEFRNRDDAYTWLGNAIEADRLSVEDMLEDEFDVTYFRPQAGDRYNPKEHTAIQSIPTDNAELGGTICECKQGGYRNIQNGRVEKNAVVVIFRYLKTQAD